MYTSRDAFEIIHFVKSSGAKPTRCHGVVSMWPDDGACFSKEVSVGNVLNRNIFDPWPSVSFSSIRIIDCILAVVVVMKGTKQLGKPKWDL